MNPRKKEIRKLLSGFYRNEDGYIVQSEGVLERLTGTARSGSVTAFIFGVTQTKRQYSFEMEKEKAEEYIFGKFKDMGRIAFVQSAPNAFCTVNFPIVSNPYAFTADFGENGEVLISFYTARGVFSFFKGLIKHSKFKKAIEKDFVKCKVTLSPQIVYPVKNEDGENGENAQQ